MESISIFQILPWVVLMSTWIGRLEFNRKGKAGPTETRLYFPESVSCLHLKKKTSLCVKLDTHGEADAHSSTTDEGQTKAKRVVDYLSDWTASLWFSFCTWSTW